MPRPRTQATLDKVDYARSLIQADPTITQAALTNAIKGMFGTGLNLQILSNLKAGRDPYAKRERRESDPVEPRYSGLYVLEEGPEKKAAEVLAKVPEVIVVTGERVLGCPETAGAVAEVVRLLEAGTRAAEIAVYRRRPVEVETKFEVWIDDGGKEAVSVAGGATGSEAD